MMSEFGRIALLIDGDNARPAYLARIIKTLSGMGEITIRKIFANWGAMPPARWNSHLLIHHALPVHVPAYKRGKNATDISLVIDAMKIAHAREADTVCIVSSDSDFTGLILHLHTEKIKVIVIGKQSASLPLIKCCDVFIDESTLPDTEKLLVQVNSKAQIIPTVPAGRAKRKPVRKEELKIAGKIAVDKFKKKVKTKSVKSLPDELVNRAFQIAANKDGIATAKNFSKAFTAIESTFHINQYGFNSFKEFLNSLSNRFEITSGVNTGTLIRRKA